MDRLYEKIQTLGVRPSPNISNTIRNSVQDDFANGFYPFVVDNLVTFGLEAFPMLEGMFEFDHPSLAEYSAVPLISEMFMEARVPDKYAGFFGSNIMGAHVFAYDLYSPAYAEKFGPPGSIYRDNFILEWATSMQLHRELTWQDRGELVPKYPVRYQLELITFMGGDVLPIMSPYRVVYFLDERGRLCYGQNDRALVFPTLISSDANPSVMLDPTGTTEIGSPPRDILSEPAHFFFFALMMLRLPDTVVIRAEPGVYYYALIRPNEKTMSEINSGKPPTSSTVLAVPLDIFETVS